MGSVGLYSHFVYPGQSDLKPSKEPLEEAIV